MLLYWKAYVIYDIYEIPSADVYSKREGAVWMQGIGKYRQLFRLNNTGNTDHMFFADDLCG